MSHKTRMPTGNYYGDDGFALLAVLAFLLLFAALLLPFSSAARLAALTSSHEFEHTRLSYAAEAANAYVAAKLASDHSWKSSVGRDAGADGMSCRIKDLTLTLRLINHAGLIDLNVAATSTIAAGLAALGLDDRQAGAVANSIVAFRSPQRGTALPIGPEPSFGLKHAPLEDVVELLDFAEMRRFTPEQLSEIFTVDSHSAFIDRDLASKPLQSILAKLDGAVHDGLSAFPTYTLTTRISRRGESAIDARIVTIGGDRQMGRRSSALAILTTAKAALPNCRVVLGTDITAWFEEAFG
ncbi:general secretion pathway protein K [Rhizobium sp. BK591]|uniref:hypothetical protein n=1 Tax=Rhizobium sp. BK591 TaxID=2586985 RepID=UPI001609A1D3|nr:hypothetical protein [Rhizobium sp. BK591]MBB3743101.1 general secretion pathway protein K [Rhizobium sp. BK591]